MIKASILMGLMTLTGFLGATSTAPKPDPKAGAQVFMARGCAACHSIKSLKGALGQIGPALDDIGPLAGKRVKGQTADVYLRQAIIAPDAYVVENYPPGLMPKLQPALPEKELVNLIAYLKTLSRPVNTPAGDAKAGAKVFLSKTCSTCHSITSLPGAYQGTIGPRLDNIGSLAGKRVAGQSAEVYLRKSILEPNDYVTPGYQPMMPPLGPTMSEQELKDLLAYLASLK